MKIYAFEINIYIFNFFDTLITSYELGIEKVIEKCENFINENSRMRMKQRNFRFYFRIENNSVTLSS